MSPPVRRFALSVHLTCSVGWIGAVIAYLGLGIAATTGNPETVRSAWPGMAIIGWYVLVPMALGSWATGLVMALGSRWGLFRHYWVVFSFVLTTVATVTLIAHMPDVSSVADDVRSARPDDLDQYGGDLFHAVLALVLLLAIQVLNLYKPTGVTPYGWRKNQREREMRASNPVV
jgi:hypothetical protein